MAKPVPPSTIEAIDHDDYCYICHLLLLKPVTTSCNHTFCETCFSQWADVSVSQMIRGLDIDFDNNDQEQPMTWSPIDLETRCPMCRTLTTATPNRQLTARLQSQYPATYQARVDEALAENAVHQDETGDGDGDGGVLLTEPLTIYIGNEHRLIRDPNNIDHSRNSRSSSSSSSRNIHEWNFFIKPSPPHHLNLIEEIQIFLHPTFSNPKIILTHPPYSIRRVGWGVFTVFVNVILKVGYSWVSPEAEDTVDGAVRGKLPLEWMLDFQGRGSQGRCRLRVRRERAGSASGSGSGSGQDVDGDVDLDLQRQVERQRRAWNRQRLRDPDYVPPLEEA